MKKKIFKIFLRVLGLRKIFKFFEIFFFDFWILHKIPEGVLLIPLFDFSIISMFFLGFKFYNPTWDLEKFSHAYGGIPQHFRRS